MFRFWSAMFACLVLTLGVHGASAHSAGQPIDRAEMQFERAKGGAVTAWLSLSPRDTPPCTPRTEKSPALDTGAPWSSYELPDGILVEAELEVLPVRASDNGARPLAGVLALLI